MTSATVAIRFLSGSAKQGVEAHTFRQQGSEDYPETNFFGLEPAPRRKDGAFLAKRIIELEMHRILDLEIQRQLWVGKMHGTRHEAGSMAPVLD
jgi:hypothetical protein